MPPFESIKLMLQSQNEMLKADRLTKPYKGIIGCAVQIYRTEGIANLLNNKFYSQIYHSHDVRTWYIATHQ